MDVAVRSQSTEAVQIVGGVGDAYDNPWSAAAREAEGEYYADRKAAQPA